MLQDERRRKILEIVEEEGQVDVEWISKEFGVSGNTARRDLRALDKEGVLRRVHGGAVSNLGRSYEPPYPLRKTKNFAAKQAIGHKAASMIQDGDSVALDVGSTTLEIAKAIKDKHNLTIITASLPIANELTQNHSLDNDIRLILTGGIIRPRELSMTGNIAEKTYKQFHFDKAFIGVGGISVEEITEYNYEDALVKNPMIKNSKRKIVVADSGKMGRTTFSTIAPLSDIDEIITDSGASPEFIEELKKRNIKVHIVN